MRTKLEAIAGYLAGRGTNSPTIDAELQDPASEASRFLAETRRKSKALVDEPAAELASNTPRPATSWRPVLLLALLIVMTAGVALWVVDRRFQYLERQVNQSRGESLDRIDEVETILTEAFFSGPRENPGEPPWKSVETSLERLEHRLELAAPPASASALAPSTATPPTTDPAFAEIRAELAAVRREVMASESANARQIQELRTILQEIRRTVTTRAQPALTPVPLPTTTTGAGPTLQTLVNNLTSPLAQVRIEAIEQIARLGPSGRAAIPTIQQMIPRETDPRVRAAAEAALTLLRQE